MSITADTPSNIIIGAGTITRDASAQGATMDDNSFTVEQDRFVPDLNGTKWELLGTDYIVKERAMLAFTLAEVNASNFGVMVPESTSSVSGDQTTITSDDTRRISTASYHDYALAVPGLDNLLVTLNVENAIQTQNAEFTAGDESVLAPRITARASADPADLTAAPWSVVVDTNSVGGS